MVACLLADGRLLGKRVLAGNSFLFVPEKETKRARRSDAAAAGGGGWVPHPKANTPPPTPPLTVGFAEPLSWRAAEVVSLLTLAGMVFGLVRSRKRKTV